MNIILSISFKLRLFSTTNYVGIENWTLHINMPSAKYNMYLATEYEFRWKRMLYLLCDCIYRLKDFESCIIKHTSQNVPEFNFTYLKNKKIKTLKRKLIWPERDSFITRRTKKTIFHLHKDLFFNQTSFLDYLLAFIIFSTI